MSAHVKFNEHGRRIGESHPRAKLTDHEVESLLMPLLDRREEFIAAMREAGQNRNQIIAVLKEMGLTYALIAAKFEIHKDHVAKIANGSRRCQTPSPLR